MALGLELQLARKKAGITLNKASEIYGTSLWNYVNIEKQLSRKQVDGKDIFVPMKRRFNKNTQEKIKATITKLNEYALTRTKKS